MERFLRVTVGGIGMVRNLSSAAVSSGVGVVELKIYFSSFFRADLESQV